MSQLIQIFKEGGLYIEVACTTHGTKPEAGIQKQKAFKHL